MKLSEAVDDFVEAAWEFRQHWLELREEERRAGRDPNEAYPYEMDKDEWMREFADWYK